jgi:hypothetical protein
MFVLEAFSLKYYPIFITDFMAQPHLWRNEVRFVRDQQAELDFYCASPLKQQSSDRHVALLGHIIKISSQPVFVLST